MYVPLAGFEPATIPIVGGMLYPNELQRYAGRNLSQLMNADLGFLLSCG